jgi:3-deoxy-D-arabino-heptulosonate 7-phosphate (DAHP) synthase class II
MGSYLPIVKGKFVMKRTSFLHLMALLVVFGTTAPVVAEESVEEMEKRCRSYAEEDSIPADELEDYIKECIQGIEQDDTQSESEPEAASGTEDEEKQD